MSIRKSKSHRVQVTLHGVEEQIHMNQDYTKCTFNTLSLGMGNISRVFEDNKYEYYRHVLSEVGNYPSGKDFKHYDDSRCKCILCWTFRTGFEHDYPTVKSKLLCVVDQLKNEKIHKNMRYSDFESLVYENVSGIKPKMVDFLWNSLFKCRPRNTVEETFDINPYIQRILAKFNVLDLHMMDLAGKAYPSELQDSIKTLQERIDKEYNLEKKSIQICNMSAIELKRSHVNLLQNKFIGIAPIPDEIEHLWKDMFLHDYLNENFSKSRVSSVDYIGFQNISKADRNSILNIKRSEFDVKISHAKQGLYLLDSLKRQKVITAYKNFKDEFSVFLTKKENNDFDRLKNINIKTKVSLEYRRVREGYMLEYLIQLVNQLANESEQWRINLINNTLDLINKENDIHRFGFQSKIQSRLNCTAAVREYIEKMWQSMRDGDMEITNSQGEKFTRRDFNKLRLQIYGERLEAYKQEYVDNKLVVYYAQLSEEQRQRVDRKWTHHMLQQVIKFINKNELLTYHRAEDVRKKFVIDTNYKNASEERQVRLNAEYIGEGGYKDQRMLHLYTQEFPMRVRVDEYISDRLRLNTRIRQSSRVELDPEFIVYSLRVLSHFMEEKQIFVSYSGNSDKEKLELYIQEFNMREKTKAYVASQIRGSNTRELDTRSVRYILQVVVDFMQGNKLLTRYKEDETTTESDRLHFYLSEFYMSQYAKDYVDAMLKGVRKQPGASMVTHMLQVVVDFMQGNKLLTRYDEKITKAQYKTETDIYNLTVEEQLKLFSKYNEYEKHKRLDYYIEEFAQSKELWATYSQHLDVQTMWDTYSKQKLNVKLMWNEFSQSRVIPDLWNVVSWYKLRKKNRLLWQWSMEESSMSTQMEMIEKKTEYLEEADAVNLADKITAEMYLMFDIFNQWRVDDDKLDKFIRNSLPPKERHSFTVAMDSLKMLTSGPVNARKEYIREAYKKIVFDKEILKRAVVLQLKKRHKSVRESWDEEVLNGRRTWGLSELQKNMRETYVDYRDLGILDRFPYDRDWVTFKYRNIRKWLTVGARVFVFCKFADVAKQDKQWDPTTIPVNTGVIAALSAVPSNWSADGKAEGLLVAWVEDIDMFANVTARLEKTLNIRKLSSTQTLDVVRVDIKNVYDSVLEYNLYRERTLEQKRQETEEAVELERLKKLNRERRELIRKISAEESSEEEKARESLKRAANDALLMFGESKTNDRLRLFNEWMTPLREESTLNKHQFVQVCIRKCQQNSVNFEMFRDGRRQWVIKLGNKAAYDERLPMDNMRSKQEQREFDWSLAVINLFSTDANRAMSNRITNEYLNFMYVYPEKGITDADIKQIILDKLEGKTPDEKREMMTSYRDNMRRAMGREDRRLDAADKVYFANMNMPGAHRDLSRIGRSLILKRRDRIFAIIDSVIAEVNLTVTHPRLHSEENIEVRNYIMSGRMGRDVDIQLKTPKLVYTRTMWISEIERSLQPLDMTTFNQFVNYVRESEEVMYLLNRKRKPFYETEYQRDFKVKSTKGTPVYPTPSNETLLKISQTFKPPRNTRYATKIRVGMGPGSWFKIDPLSDLMRQTGMSMEDRMLFAEDVKQMRESERWFSNEHSTTLRRMKNILTDKTKYSTSDPRSGWIESDGDGTIRIVDDFVGVFTFSDSTYKSHRSAADDDIPTHMRLNHVYFDTKRGMVDQKNVRRLVPFYIVSLYKKEGSSCRRLRVRNRADRTFLPRQNKLSKPYDLQDYKGYECSICLNQDEFDALNVEQVAPGVDRRIIQIPRPFLFKYHKILYADAKEEMEDRLIARMKDPSITLEDPILTVDDPDDMAAPFSDGMIRLAGDVRSMTAVGGTVEVNGRYFDVGGNIVSPPDLDLTVEGDKLCLRGEKAKRLPYEVSFYSIHSNMMVATFGNESTPMKHVNEDKVYVWKKVRGKWIQLLISSQSCSMLRWCRQLLLVVDNDVVKGFKITNTGALRMLTLKGHRGSISYIDVRSNKIVTCSKDKTLIVWKNIEPAISNGSRVVVEDSKNDRFGNVKAIYDFACEVELFRTDREGERT